MIVFDQEYCDETLNDVERDVIEAFDPKFNPCMPELEKDEYGFSDARYRITIELIEDEE